MRRETNPPVIGANSFPYANMAVTLKSASETIYLILVLVNQIHDKQPQACDYKQNTSLHTADANLHCIHTPEVHTIEMSKELEYALVTLLELISRSLHHAEAIASATECSSAAPASPALSRASSGWHAGLSVPPAARWWAGHAHSSARTWFS